MTEFLSFESGRLILRPTDQSDAAFLVALYNSPKWIRFIGDRNIRTTEQALVFIKERIRPQLKQKGFSNYTVIRKADQIKLGACGLYDRDGLDGIDLGFAFLPEFEKKGYAFEASKILMKAANTQFNLLALKAITTDENLDSQRLLLKLGFKFIKKIRLPNDSVELRYYFFSF